MITLYSGAGHETQLGAARLSAAPQGAASGAGETRGTVKSHGHEKRLTAEFKLSRESSNPLRRVQTPSREFELLQESSNPLERV